MIEGYGGRSRGSGRGGAILWLLLPILLGLAGAAIWLRWSAPSADSGPSGPIEWNEVQDVPRRAPDADDVAWEKRAKEQGSPSTGSGPMVEEGSTVSGANIKVIDGDTFEIGGTRVRIAGIDAPETHPARCPYEAQLGAAATQRLAELLRSGQLWISGNVIDRWGRSVRVVRVDGEDVADAMIGSGLARNYAGKQRQDWC